MRKKYIQLTENQAKHLLWLSRAAEEQHIKILQCDDDDTQGMTKKEKYEYFWFNRECQKAIKLLKIKLLKARKNGGPI